MPYATEETLGWVFQEDKNPKQKLFENNVPLMETQSPKVNTIKNFWDQTRAGTVYKGQMG